MSSIFYTGALPRPEDERDRPYRDIAVGAAPFDWKTGFDVRNSIGSDFPTTNQGETLSCVGASWSQKIWLYKVVEALKLREEGSLPELLSKYPQDAEKVSFKAIYSQIKLPQGGAYIYKGGRLATTWGSVDEPIVPSHKQDGTISEQFVSDLSWKTDVIDEIAKKLLGKELRRIYLSDGFDMFAHAIKNELGVVGGVYGDNGDGWDTERPTTPERKDWGHALFFGAAGQDEFGKFIATPNTWGKQSWNKDYVWKKGDPVGAGWQKLYIDYFKPEFMFDAWTYTDILSTMNTFVRVIKDVNGAGVGFFLPAHSEDTIKNMAALYGKEVPMKDGHIDWDNFIEGTATFNSPLEQ